MAMPMYNNEMIGKSLVEAELIDESQLEEALRVLRNKEEAFVGKVLFDLEMLPEEELLGFFIEKWGCPLFPLGEGARVNPESLKLVPKEVAKKNLFLPVDNIGGLVTVCSAGPIETYVMREEIKELKELKGCMVRYQLNLITDIEAAIDKLYG
jgi:type IV pilus assembly protein PilB